MLLKLYTFSFQLLPHDMWILVVQRITLEFILDIIYFPVWWFTAGARHAFIFCIGLVKEANSMMAPGLWLKNIFVPMFGQWDFQGRLVSFFMRLGNVIIRSIALFIWVIVVIFIFFLWILFPTFIFYMLITSFLSFT